MPKPRIDPARRSALWLLALLCLARVPSTHADAPLQVFAAASLANVMASIAPLYQRQTGRELQFSYAASSTLARQISHGAPAHVFISANPRWMQYLIDAGSAVEARTLLHNQLLLVAPAGSELRPTGETPSAEDLRRWLQSGRLAVGDPAHVPVGLYARTALQQLGVWDTVRDHLAPTEDARASLALLQRREVALGIVYRSDLHSVPELQTIAELSLPPGQSIDYPASLIATSAHPQAKEFLAFLRSAPARQLFERAGFGVAP